jgi:hypothetical protein
MLPPPVWAAVAVNVTLLPAQILVELAAMLTVGVILLTVTVVTTELVHPPLTTV